MEVYRPAWLWFPTLYVICCRYVKDRLPGIEEADLDDDDVMRQLMAECQARGVSPSCIKHLRLLKQFLLSLAAIRKGVSPPRYKVGAAGRLGGEEGEEECGEDCGEADARLVVEAGIYSPPGSPAHYSHYSPAASEGEEGGEWQSGSTAALQLRVRSPGEVNSVPGTKRPVDLAEQGGQTGPPAKRERGESGGGGARLAGESGAAVGQEKEPGVTSLPGTADILQTFQREMMDKYLQFQRESEVRFLQFEQVVITSVIVIQSF